MCLDDGTYMMNYSKCAVCQALETLLIDGKVRSEDEDGQEIITYQHVCPNCEHVVASHEYTFCVDDQYMMYTMSCALCGEAEDDRCILPYDESQRALF